MINDSTIGGATEIFKKSILFLSFILFGVLSYGQNDSDYISGKILNKTNKPLGYATVLILDAKGAVLSSGISDKSGNFKVKTDLNGTTIIKVTMLGFRKYIDTVSEELHHSFLDLGDIFLIQDDDIINDSVTVHSTRKELEIKNDRSILNNVSEDPLSTGASALELILKFPGVKLAGDKLSFNGKSGITLNLDGKTIYLAGDDLINYLKSLHGENISKLELITNPSAKYDASGDAGVIGISLVRDTTMGMEGNLSLTSTYTSYKPKYSVLGNLSTKFKKFDLHLNASTSRGYYKSKNIYNREHYNSDGGYLNVFQKYFNRNISSNKSVDLLINYRLASRLSVSFDNSYSFTKNEDVINSSSKIKKVRLDSTYFLQAQNSMRPKMKRYSSDLFLNYLNKRSEFQIDGSIGKFVLPNRSSQENYYKSDNHILDDTYFKYDTRSDIRTKSVKFDYIFSLDSFKLEAGLKNSWVSSNNSSHMSMVSSKDSSSSESFLYKELISAGYVSLFWSKTHFNFDVGIRAENSNIKSLLTSSSYDTVQLINANKLSFFPYLNFEILGNRNRNISIIFNKRIDRPNYKNLNPFIFVIDEMSYRKGNPFLAPQTTNTFKIFFSGRHSFTSSISFDRINDFIVNYRDTVLGETTVQSYRNFDHRDIFTLAAGKLFKITDWWSMDANASLYYDHVNGVVNSKDILDMKQLSYNVSTTNSFNISSGYKLKIFGFYNSKFLDVPAIIDGQWSVNLAAEKSFFNERASIKISITDLLNSYQFKLHRDFGGLKYYNYGTWESRQIRLNFSFRFGNNKFKKDVDKKSGLEDIEKRIKL